MSASVFYCHLLAGYLIVGIPVMGFLRNRKAKAQIQTGDAQAKTRFLRGLVVKQVINLLLVCGLWWFGGVRAEKLGLREPPSWPLTASLTVGTVVCLIVSAYRLRAKSAKIRKTLDQRAGALLPDSVGERRWFAAVCVCGGIFEEFAYRGFLFYYLSLLFPAITGVEQVLVTTVLFGVGHLYQGWKGILSTGAAGLIMGVLYLLGGNLLAPVVAHILANLRVLLIFPPPAKLESKAPVS